MALSKTVRYPIVLAIIAALCVAGIDIVYSSVVDKIRLADRKKAMDAVGVIFKDCSPEDIESKQSDYEGDTVNWYKCPDGYAVIAAAQGFDGAVTIMAGWDENLEQLMGISVLSHTETPGLGGNVDLVNSENTWLNVITGSMKDETGKRPDFQLQFDDLSLQKVNLKRDGGAVDAMSGATITSRAVVNAARESHKILKAILEKEK